MRAVYTLSRYLIIAATGGIFALAINPPPDGAALSAKSSCLLVHCTQDGSCVRIAAYQTDAKSGMCSDLSITTDTNRLKANMACRLPAGPLIGDVAFTKKANGTIDVGDRDNNQTAILYRCPN